MRAPVTAETITEAQIRDLEDDDGTSPSLRWDCQVARRDHRIKLRSNKTKAAVSAARARVADAYNSRVGRAPEVPS